jgi:predicted DNA-binding WGR domain protein
MITERYEYIAGNSAKFWEVTYPDLHDTAVRWWKARWGRIGTEGQSKQFFSATSLHARYEAVTKISEKQVKGYERVSGSWKPPLPPKPLAANKLPIIKVQAQHEHKPTEHKPTEYKATKMTGQDVNAILALIAAGFSNKDISDKLRIEPAQVRAIAAHNTMGRYESPIKGHVTNNSKSRGGTIKRGKRKFFIDE